MIIVSNLYSEKPLRDERRHQICALPEIIQFAKDFFVFNVAAVVLAERRSADWTFQTTQVPVQVINLRRTTGGIITE